MEIWRIRTLSGPNVWSRKQALEAWVDLGALKDTASNEVPGFNERLSAWFPGLIEHRCSVGERGGFLKRLADGTYPAHILEHVSIELQNRAGTPVGFGKARETSQEGVYRVVIRYREEAVARAALYAARDLLVAAYQGRDFDVEGTVAKLKDLAESVCLGPSTAAIVNAAQARGIPARRLNSGSLVQLGFGAKQRRIWTAETDATSAVAESIAQDKELTKQLLRAAGVPVPEGRVVSDPADAWEAAQDVGVPVVVKPTDGNHGRGVCTNLFTEAQVTAAFETARREGSSVIVERYAPGAEHRLLVVGGKLVAAARGDAAYVTGDAKHSISQLIELQLNSDPRRGESHNSPLAKVELSPTELLVLQQQGLTPDSIPEDGARVLIQRNGNLRVDVTDDVHPQVAAHAELAAKVVGLDVAGLDLVAEDIAKPLEMQGGAIVEVNAGPGLHAHLMPGVGKPRPVGEAIVETLFPAGATGRIPIACVTGTNGKTTVAKLVAHLVSATGRTIGLTTSDGITIKNRLIERGDCGGPRSARKVLMHPDVELAVFEAGRGGILREGLGFDKCDVAIVTNIGSGDHLGRHDVNTPEDMFTVKRCPVDVVLPSGASVLNAADPLVADMARLSDGAVIFFARDASHPIVTEHLAKGGKAAFVRDGALVLAEGAHETRLLALTDLAFADRGRAGFHVENALAASAAAWALGASFEQIARGLASFDARELGGRFALFAHRGATVVVDDCHNLSALEATVQALENIPHGRRIAVFSAGAHRRDEDVIAQGRALAAHFDRVVIYEDSSATERPEGELSRLFARGLEAGGRVTEVIDIRDHATAVETALRMTRAGDLVLVQTEDATTEPTMELVKRLVDDRTNDSAPTPATLRAMPS